VTFYATTGRKNARVIPAARAFGVRQQLIAIAMTVTMAVEWTTEETRVLLRVWGDADIQNKFDGVVRNRHIYGGKYEEAWV
jgi:hypothetical protein